MRQIALTILLLITGVYGICQTIVNTNKKWNTIAVCAPWSSPTIFTESIVFGQDTIIEMKLYKNVMRSIDEFQTYWEVYGFIRESTENEVFFRTDTSTQEYLLFDFSAQENETLLIYGIEGFMETGFLYSETLMVDSIDSIFIAGEYRKRINLGNVQWIEGVGSLSGILHNSFGLIGGDGFELLCYSENDNLLYQNTFYASCYRDNTFNEDINKPEILKIYPNPSDGYFNVEFNLPDKSKCELRIFGLNNYTKAIFPVTSNTTQINTQGWSSGVYMCSLFVDGKLVKVEKLVFE